MSTELCLKDGTQIAVRFYGGVDRGMGVQMCVNTFKLLQVLDEIAFVEGYSEETPARTVRQVLNDWFAAGDFEEQSYNLDPKSFIKSRAIPDFKNATKSFFWVFNL